MKCIFIGNPVPKDFLMKTNNTNFSTADNIAQNDMIEGLYEAYGENLTVITASANFENPKVLNKKTKRKKIKLDCGAEAVGVGNLNYGKAVFYLSIIFTYTLELFKILKKIKKSENILIISNGPYLFTALPIRLSKFFYKSCYIPFLIGSVELPEYTGFFKLISKLSPLMIRMADATITYVEKTSIDYTNKPYLAILYSLDEEKIKWSKDIKSKKKEKKDTGKLKVLYTGALSKIKGADTLVSIIESTKDKYHWIICGDGEYRDKFKELGASKNYDVDFLGVVSNYKAVVLQHYADVLIAFQFTESEIYRYYSKYAASGKLIEYLLSGTPILTPDVENISIEIRPFLNYFPDQSITSIETCLDNVDKNRSELMEKAVKGRAYVMKKASNVYQNRKVIHFIEEICHEKYR